MTIYALRHFITPWNQESKLQGSVDIDIIQDDSANLILRDAVLKRLLSIKLDKVYVSPKKRAQSTARMLELDDYETEELITEMSFGRFEGVEKSIMLDAFKGNWEKAPFNTELKPSLLDLEQRVKEFINKLKESDSDRCLVISHGAFIRAMIAYLATESIETMNQVEIQNGELIVLRP